MEKFKNILHDFGDVFIALMIAFLMFSVVAWNLGDWFDDTTTADAVVTNTTEDKGYNKNIEKIDKPTKVEDILEDTSSNEEVIEIVAAETKKIVIPSGTPGTGIAKILQDNDLIKDVDTFLKTVEDLNLASKLKSGTFEISSDATIEEMVKIISKSN